MDCRQCQQLLPQWLNGELDGRDAALVAAHVACCAACRAEADLWREIGTALKAGTVEIKAPPALARQVTAQLNARAKPRHLRWVQSWKRYAAAAAAFVLVTAGTLGFAVNQFWMRGINAVADNDDNQPTVVIQNSGSSIEGPVPKDNPPGNQNEGTNDNPDTNPDTNIDKQPQDRQTPDNSNIKTTGTNKPAGKDLQPGGFVLTYADIDKKRVLESTLLVVQVGDMEKVQQQLDKLAAEFGAQYENLGAAGRQENFKITVGTDKDDELLQRLSTIGQVINKQKTDRDITEEFRKRVQQLGDLKAERDAASNADEIKKLDAQIANMETELQDWMALENKHTIVLVVEER
ncbi:MAG: zf-HC2 domain-containing protein [Peptococcaceae bacterium]|nr:zf-HC2 domain-containing protein [Peptococcaceae bacterium]